MKIKKIDRETNDFQHAMAVRDNRAARQKYREFFVEGVRSIESLLAHKWEATAVYYDADRKLSDWAKKILDSSRAPKHYPLSGNLMKKLSEKEETSELLMLARMPDDDFARLPVHENLLAVLLDRPANPGNLGTSIRSCDALAADCVIITGHAADPYHPQAVRGSMGSLFAQKVVRSSSHQELLEWSAAIRERYGRLKVIGTSSHAEHALWQIDYSGPVILCMGNETTGLAPRLQELCNEYVSIPQYGWASSLNISCALSIMLYQISRQRRGS